ncbi:MAG TPA: hypothetical protein VIO59_11300 [Rhodanobacter sp.]
MDKSLIDDLDEDECPECGVVTAFDLVWVDECAEGSSYQGDDEDADESESDHVDRCTECGSLFENGEVDQGHDICFYCQTGEEREP